jgi:hypothetical protein
MVAKRCLVRCYGVHLLIPERGYEVYAAGMYRHHHLELCTELLYCGIY